MADGLQHLRSHTG
ncbi:hypothetical protein BIW11_04217 [Tropilaelaps mercedesae]|uniref:Uncharacterized protein n=1 Tax=Tropilaelaps mercedesae TaxID=418985 RepID=A0A1V9X987_9ACAR|nr:hypothetical protein BIW11_04217 [Tropilaelaps mercedesae]